MDAIDSINHAAGESEELRKNTPLGRAGQSVEVAPMYVFLASNESSYVTGDAFGVAGGRVLALVQQRRRVE